MAVELAQGFEALYTGNFTDVMHDTGRAAFEAVKKLKNAHPQQYQPANSAAYPHTPYGKALRQTAQLIKADVGLEIAFMDIGGWDTHANQGSSRGQLANGLQELSQGIAALYRDLDDHMGKIVVLTMTEFGAHAPPEWLRGYGSRPCQLPVCAGRSGQRWQGVRYMARTGA